MILGRAAHRLWHMWEGRVEGMGEDRVVGMGEGRVEDRVVGRVVAAVVGGQRGGQLDGHDGFSGVGLVVNKVVGKEVGELEPIGGCGSA